MNPAVLHDQTPDEALIAYYDLIGNGQTPINVHRLADAAEYDAFIGTERFPSPTGALFDVAWELKDTIPDYTQPIEGADQRAQYLERYGSSVRSGLVERFKYLRTEIILDTLVELVQEDTVPIEQVGRVAEAAVVALATIERPDHPQLPGYKRKALRKSFKDLQRNAGSPRVRARSAVVVEHLPASRGRQTLGGLVTTAKAALKLVLNANSRYNKYT